MTDQLKFDYPPAHWQETPPDFLADCFHPKTFSSFPPEACAALTKEQSTRLSLQEAIHFFSSNIAGEGYVIDTAEQSPPALFEEFGLSEYRSRLIDEERDHTKAFKFYISTAGQTPPESHGLIGKIRPLQTAADLAEYASKIIMFEHVSEQVSAAAVKDLRIEPVTRSLHKYHWDDERHHVGAGARAIPILLRHLSHNERDLALSRAMAWAEILKRIFFPDSAAQRAGISNPEKIQRLSFTFHDSHPGWNAAIRQAEALVKRLYNSAE